MTAVWWYAAGNTRETRNLCHEVRCNRSSGLTQAFLRPKATVWTSAGSLSYTPCLQRINEMPCTFSRWYTGWWQMVWQMAQGLVADGFRADGRWSKDVWHMRQGLVADGARAGGAHCSLGLLCENILTVPGRKGKGGRAKGGGGGG